MAICAGRTPASVADAAAIVHRCTTTCADHESRPTVADRWAHRGDDARWEALMGAACRH